VSGRDGLNPEQLAAVEFGDGPLRIMAGAGTGKTHTLTQRIVALVDSGRARPSEILALTFTTKAAEELTVRVAAAFAGYEQLGGDRVDVDTYHAFGGRIVAEHGHWIDLPPEPIVLTPPEAWILLWRSLDEIDFQHIDLTYLRGSFRQRSPLYDMINLGSRLGDELRSLEDLQSYLATAAEGEETEKLRDYARALAVYRQRKQALGAIDYGDQIALACALLERPDVAAVYRSRYRYLLVDEFQDTNYSQSVLVRLLAGDPTGNVCVVGDPNQAIYGFRGAAPDNLDRYADREFPTAHTVALYQNFRSTQAILDVANSIWVDAPGDYRGNLIAAKDKPGERPRLVACATLNDEIAYIAADIGRLVAAGRRYDEIVILVRKNAMKRELYRALRERRIPVEAVGGTSLFETAEVRELISYLRAIGNPTDDPAVAHVLCAERWGLDERALYEIAQARGYREPLITTTRRLVADGKGTPELAACLQSLGALTARAYRIGLRRLVDEIVGLRHGGYDAVEHANVDAFIDVVRQFTESRVERPGLSDLLAYLDLLLTAGPEEEAALEGELGDRNTVKIMTAHGAKGLESPIVFVAGANKNDFRASRARVDALPAELAQSGLDQPKRDAFPSDTKGEKAFTKAVTEWRKEQLELEERRVLYVALTRARERLIISWARSKPGRKNDSVLLPALEPSVELCELFTAPSAAEATPAAPAFRQIAPRLLAPITSALDGSAEALTEALTGGWRRVGGDPAVPAAAVDRFIGERETTREHVEIIRAVELRQALDGADAGAAGGVISYTQLETFRACPHRYFLRYVAGMPGLPDRRAAAIGTAFHAAIATEAQRRSAGLPVAAQQVKTWFEAEVAFGSAATTPSGNGNGVSGDPIAHYLASPDATAEPLLVEEAFSLRLGPSVLRGVIDRVHRLPDGTTEVVDYKTDRATRSEAEVRAGWQLPVYLLACRDVFPQIQPVPQRAVMFFVRANERVEVVYSEDELAAVRQELATAALELRSVSADAHRSGPGTCATCEYRPICKYVDPSTRESSNGSLPSA
jgi:DNA helicase-2/ATP-dependent DNA helicase PcrA